MKIYKLLILLETSSDLPKNLKKMLKKSIMEKESELKGYSKIKFM